MHYKLYFVSFFLVFSILGISQNMQEGFNYLETGKYDKAKLFFKTVLDDYPKNKTAQLCYGRAVGLSGNSKHAVAIFTDLLKVYPNDFEIKLNYAEALLWNTNYDLAKPYYEGLVKENKQSFPALLGYANTLSNLKLYNEALGYVNKALNISPGNPNALNSKKYMYLGYAYQNQQRQNYDEAERLLKENLTFFKNDKETLLNLANLYLITEAFDDAKAIYKTIGTLENSKMASLNGLALVAHLKNKDKTALKLSAEAYKILPDLKDKTLIQQTQERYIQALIWNRKYNKAQALIDELTKTNPNANWVLALSATLHIYKNNFKKSLADYNRILENDSTSFDGNLGKANALKALEQYNEAYLSAGNTLKFYNNQKDATQFIKDLNTRFTPFLDTKGAFSFDNGDNEAFTLQTALELPTSTRFKWLAHYGYRSTRNTVTHTKASSNDFSLGLAYQLLPNLGFKGTLGITSAKVNTDDYTQLLTDLSFHIKPFKLQVLDVGYKREIQNFNADLLDREIVMNHFYANYNVSTNFNLGWFTQYYYTSQNDDNTRNLLFTSLYYNLLRKPALKAGFNYQYIAFKNQVPMVYFSPEKFNAYEAFINLIKDEVITEPQAWFYELTAATGYQFIENNNKQSTYRIQGKLGYKFTDRTLLNIYGTRSNIASATAAGFTFTEIGLRFKWYLGKQPNFSN